MPKIVKVNSKDTNTIGTCLQGEITATYEEIKSKLGEPSNDHDGYKSDAEWHLEFEDGSVATIYTWKNGKNYCGEHGLDTPDITEWHIGGRDPKVQEWVNDYIHNS